MPTKPKTIPFGAPPIASTSAPAAPVSAPKTIPFGAPPITAPSSIPREPSALASMAKSLFTAPATIVARPFQAAAELAGASDTQVDEFTKKIPVVGGLIAPVPQGIADVKKDAGRAIQTVALGTGAPIAGGAAFGLGSSLEQGNDLASVDTAIQTAFGAAGGKALAWVGKPLFNAAGKVVGTITPKLLKSVAGYGTKAIQDFAEQNQLLGGIAAKPSAALARGAQAVDDKIGAAASSVTRATGNVLKEQFPGLDPVEHYKAVNEKDFLRPTTVNKAAYAKSTAIYNDAKSRGIDLEKMATKRGIIVDHLRDGNAYNTLETADALRDFNYEASKKIGRPAIKAAQQGVQRVPVADVRDQMIRKINDMPASQVEATDREGFIEAINKKYGPNGAEARAHPNGYNLEDLHDNRISRQQKGKYLPGQPASDAINAQRSREEGRVFGEIFDDNLPPNSPLIAFRKEQEANFRLADYLEKLHTKRVPQGIVGKSIRLFGRGLGGVIGSKVGGFPGFLVGSRGGDILFDSFETFPNPIKTAVLESLKAENPKAFRDLVAYIGQAEAERLARKALPGPGQTSFKEVPPTLFAGKKVSTTPIKNEAFDTADVANGKIKAPGTDRRLSSYMKKVENAGSADQQYFPNEDAIQMGPKPKSKKNLTDILFGDANSPENLAARRAAKKRKK